MIDKERKRNTRCIKEATWIRKAVPEFLMKAADGIPLIIKCTIRHQMQVNITTFFKVLELGILVNYI